jgi:hypothetical protein
MSKKSRKRNKKILGALAAGLGAMALMKRRKTNALNAITAGDIVDTGTLSGKAGFEGDVPSASVPSASVVVPKKKWVSTNPLASRKWNKMDVSEVRPGYVAPSTQRYNKPDFGMGAWDGAKDGGRIGHKSGGRVGCGKAKRGFGRALKKK